MRLLRSFLYQTVILAIACVGLFQGLVDLLVHKDTAWAVTELVLFGIGLLIIGTFIEMFDREERARRWSEISAFWRLLFSVIVHLPGVPNKLALIATELQWTRNQYIFETIGRFSRSYFLVPAGLILWYTGTFDLGPGVDLWLRITIPVLLVVAVVRVSFDIPFWATLGLCAGILLFLLGVYVLHRNGILSNRVMDSAAELCGGYATELPKTAVLWFTAIWFGLHLVLTLFCVAFRVAWANQHGAIFREWFLKLKDGDTGTICRVTASEADLLSALMPGELSGQLTFRTPNATGGDQWEMRHVPYHGKIWRILTARANFQGGSPVQVTVQLTGGTAATATASSP